MRGKKNMDEVLAEVEKSLKEYFPKFRLSRNEEKKQFQVILEYGGLCAGIAFSEDSKVSYPAIIHELLKSAVDKIEDLASVPSTHFDETNAEFRI
jgi:hypothetical protein